MKKNSLLFILVLIISISFWSCQESQMPVENNSVLSSKSLSKGGNIKAILKLYTEHIAYGTFYELKFQKLKESWEETEVTWNSRIYSFLWDTPGGDYEGNSVTYKVSMTGDEPRIIEFDISKLWEDGAPQFGIILRAVNFDKLEDGKRIKFSSIETETGVKPELEITYFDNNIVKTLYVPVIGDAEILDGASADSPLGSKTTLYAGKSTTSYEIRSVLKFDLPDDIPGGNDNCTHTKAYWKTHAKGKKKDPTWDLLEPDGKDTKFFKSKKSYYKILWTPPRHGNVYYLLAYEYIAAKLNKLNGAEFSDVSDTFDKATKLFEKYTPKQIKRLKKDNELKKDFLELTKNIRYYNTGEVGPGHCDDYKWDKKEKEWEKWFKDKWGKWKKHKDDDDGHSDDDDDDENP